MKIPHVKTWIITTINGDKFEVWAPTKLLARMNFYIDHSYGYIIKTVGLKKSEREA
jgi:hypothetical protein